MRVASADYQDTCCPALLTLLGCPQSHVIPFYDCHYQFRRKELSSVQKEGKMEKEDENVLLLSITC